MAARADFLEDALGLCNDCVDAADSSPLDWTEWTPPQDAFLRLNPPSGVKLFRSGNQAIGKSYALLAEVIFRATGRHPHYRTKAPPVDVWVVCTTWSQSVAIQCKFWDLAPKAELTAKTRDRFSIEDGWGRGNPVARFTNGSIVRFRTTGQGPRAQAGASPDFIAIDEPTTETMFRELRKRVMRTGGQLALAMTPVNFPCEWMRDQVAKGMIDEVWTPLVASALIPIGSTEPLQTIDHRTGNLIPMDQSWIDELRRTTPAQWIPVVLDGGWEAAPEGVFFKCFDRTKHVSDKMRLDPARGEIRMLAGIDYAAADRPFGHILALVQVLQTTDERGRPSEDIYVLDEVAASGVAHNSQFVADVATMLGRHGLRWTNLHAVHGDNPVQGQFVEKSNLNTMRALANEFGIPISALRPRILNAKEGIKSVASRDHGNQYLYERIASGHLMVHPRCAVIIKGFETWDYTATHPYKDGIDALRYALKLHIFSRGGHAAPTVRMYGRAA